jgi:hypothetical protein
LGCFGSNKNLFLKMILVGCAAGTHGCGPQRSGEHRRPGPGHLIYNCYTDKKENNMFLICREIQSGAVANSYMRKGFLIHMMKCGNIFHI